VLHLRDGSGNITVRSGGSSSAAVVTGTRRWRRGRARDIRFTVTQQGNDYYICAMWRGSGKCGASGYRGRQTGSLLTMFSLFHRNSDAAADFVAEVPSNVVVDAKTTNGSVRVDGLSAGVTARTTNGLVDASNVSGPLNLTTVNGNVRLTIASLSESDPVHVTTTNGTIRAELPANIQGMFDLSVMNGVVRSDFDFPTLARTRGGRHIQGQLGTSTRMVKMRSTNGAVTIISRSPVTPAAGQ